MTTRRTKKTSSVYLTHEETDRARRLSPIPASGSGAGEPSLTQLTKVVIDIGELARPLAPTGELPWAIVRALVQSAVARKAPRRVRT